MSKMEKRAAAAFWLLFVFLFVVICVLSFQSGSTTKALEKPFVETVTGTVDRQLSRETILTITFYIRQAGRAVLFFCPRAQRQRRSASQLQACKSSCAWNRVLCGIIWHFLFYGKDENIYRGQTLRVRGMSGEFCLRGARLALHGAVLFPEEQEKELLCIRRNQICRI